MKITLFDHDGTLLVVSSGNKVHHASFDEAMHTVFNLPQASIKSVSMAGKIDSQILIETAMLNGIPEKESIELLPKAFDVMTSFFEAHKHEVLLMLKKES